MARGFVLFTNLSIKQPSTIGGIESFKESAIRNHRERHTDVIQFAEITADERLAQKAGFAPGSELYYIQRVRYLDGKALIIDINMFFRSLVPGLTPEIAKDSIYDYIENTLGMQIVTSKRKMTVERTTELDEKYLELNDYNCLAVVTGQTFNADGGNVRVYTVTASTGLFLFSGYCDKKVILGCSLYKKGGRNILFLNVLPPFLHNH